VGAIPGRVIDPSVKLTNFEHTPPPPWSQFVGFTGSRFGMIHGFTQRGCTGMIDTGGWLPTFPELEELKASAVAVALTLFPLFPQMREKKVGRPARWSCTVTIGLTPKGPGVGKVAQFADELPPAEYSTLGVGTAAPPTAL
jgi:hypothetical protein